MKSAQYRKRPVVVHAVQWDGHLPAAPPRAARGLALTPRAAREGAERP